MTTLLQEAKMLQAFLKAGIYGDAKSGKSYTASLIAIGLHKLINSQKPIAYFDTETGSEYLLPTLYQPAGIKLISYKSRSFSDLLTVYKEAVGGMAEILIIDSISHVWAEIQRAYKQKYNTTYIEMQDWQPIKENWGAFTDEYLNAKLHVIVCGRSKEMYEQQINDKGKAQQVVVGTRMATEKNLAYEPSLLVEMEKVLDKHTGFITPRAWILGDRFSQIDGKVFDKPTFNTFMPHIGMLNIGGEHQGVDVSSSSKNLFNDDNDNNRYEYNKKKAIALEKIEAEMDLRFPSRTDAGKQKRLNVCKEIFGTFSKVEIEAMRLETLLEKLTLLSNLPNEPKEK